MAVVLPAAGAVVEAMRARIPGGLTYPSDSGNLDEAAAALEAPVMTREEAAEAEDVLRKWLQYIPTAANPGGWQPKA